MGRFCPKCGEPLSGSEDDAVSSPSVATTAFRLKKDVKRGPVGVWGWNTIPMLSLLCMAILSIIIVMRGCLRCVTGSMWSKLAQVSEACGPMFAVAIHIAYWLITGILCVYALILAVRRSVSYPRLAIGLFCATFIYYETFATFLNQGIGEVHIIWAIRIAVFMVIWICYLKQSVRIKNTFVNASANWWRLISWLLVAALIVFWFVVESVNHFSKKVQLSEGGLY